jgi:hypothetical protein
VDNPFFCDESLVNISSTEAFFISSASMNVSPHLIMEPF